MVVPVSEVELWSLLPAAGAPAPGALGLVLLAADVSLVTGGVPGVEAWLPLLLIAELLEELGAAPAVLDWSGEVELGLVELAEPLPHESEIMLTELTCKLLLSPCVPFTST
jgi:hypothetical protein